MVRILVGAIAFAAWEIFVRARESLATPSLLDIVPEILQLLNEGRFWQGVRESLSALGLGYAISVALALPLGFLMGRFDTIRRVASPYVTVFLAAPLAALVPVIIVLFGVGLGARVATIVIFGWPLTAATVATGVATIDRRLMEMAKSYGHTGLSLTRKVLLPAAVPTVFVGLRLGVGRAVIGMVVAELIVISAGFGALIDQALLRFDYPRMYAIVFLMVSIGWSLTQMFHVLERRASQW